jgi:hypothetical protein
VEDRAGRALEADGEARAAAGEIGAHEHPGAAGPPPHVDLRRVVHDGRDGRSVRDAGLRNPGKRDHRTACRVECQRERRPMPTLAPETPPGQLLEAAAVGPHAQPDLDIAVDVRGEPGDGGAPLFAIRTCGSHPSPTPVAPLSLSLAEPVRRFTVMAPCTALPSGTRCRRPPDGPSVPTATLAPNAILGFGAWLTPSPLAEPPTSCQRELTLPRATPISGTSTRASTRHATRDRRNRTIPSSHLQNVQPGEASPCVKRMVRPSGLASALRELRPRSIRFARSRSGDSVAGSTERCRIDGSERVEGPLVAKASRRAFSAC